MLFDQFLGRFSFLTANKNNQANKKTKRPLLNPSKDESARLSLEKANQLISEKKYKKALSVINASLEDGITSNQLLFQKAFLLSQNDQHSQAQAIWQQLSNLKNKPKLAALAKESLQTSKSVQKQAIKNKKLLIENIRA